MEGLTDEQIHPLIRKRKDNVKKWEELKTFFYYHKGHSYKILGSDEREWTSTLIFYSVFYLGLFTFFAVLLGIFSLILDEIRPMHYGAGTPTGHMPGLAYRPQPDFETTLIRFVQGRPSTYKPYTDHLQVFLEQYENEAQVGENFIDCDNGRDDNDWQENKVCRFNVDRLGGMCTWQKDFGYDEGQPCIILKLNKLYNWWPSLYDQEDVPDRDDDLHDRWDEDFLPVRCEGRYDADIENIGNITYYPPQGFPRFYFPYKNQEGYRSPLLMVRFENPVNGVVVNVVCKVWAKNVPHSIEQGIGVVTFALLVD